jgi:site-specific recombinase XerC
MPSAFSLDKEDYSCLKEDHPRKLAMKNKTTVVGLNKTQRYSADKEKFKLKYDVIKATFHQTGLYKNSISRNLMKGWYFLYYLVSKKNATRPAKLFNAFQQPEMAIRFLDVDDSKLLRLTK